MILHDKLPVLRFSHDFHVVGRGKSFPKHVGLVKARFGELGYGAAGNRSRVQRRGFRLTVFFDLTCPVPRLRRADLAFLSLFCWPLAGGSNSCYWGLFGWAPVRIGVNSAFSSVSGLVLDFEGRVFALPRARLCFDIEAYCPGLRSFRCHGHQCQLIFEVWVPTRQSVRPPDLWPSEARTPPPSRARICATRRRSAWAFLLIAPSVLMRGFQLSFQGWAQP